MMVMKMITMMILKRTEIAIWRFVIHNVKGNNNDINSEFDWLNDEKQACCSDLGGQFRAVFCKTAT